MQLHIIVVAREFKIDVDAYMNEKQNDATPSDAVTDAWIGLMRAQQRLLGQIEADLKSAGLPPLSWYDVLWELVRSPQGRLRPFEIEERTLLAQYNLSRLIDRLEKAGLVQRETFDQDGRGQWVVVTEDGRSLQKRMWQVYAKAIEDNFGAKLSTADAAALTSLLARFS
ncbi:MULTISPECIES: MarR family transcriptional regulator [unclassified Rhizobium]|uniref:MarR family winged helix-turn-helix transcriptional regulator n=1 Tax=unclassified Rhizobium TaxID=2613769 RepID=UPI00105236B1|nr:MULTISPECIES: MarR family transcriptional regulator [unclassified Rhizobium]